MGWPCSPCGGASGRRLRARTQGWLEGTNAAVGGNSSSTIRMESVLESLEA